MNWPAESSGRPDFFLRRIEWSAAIIISFAVAAFHFELLAHAGGFWRDEVNLINISGHHSIYEMTKDSFPILMPLLVKCWTFLGLAQSDAGLRVLGTFIGLSAVGGLWAASLAARGSTPLAGLVVFGLNNMVITSGDSIRAYGLGNVCIALTFAAACLYLARPGWTRAGLFAASAVLSTQALYHNAIIVGAICLGALAVCARKKNWAACAQIFATGLAAAVSLLPYCLNFITGSEAMTVLRSGSSESRFIGGLMHALGFPWQGFVIVWVLLACVTMAMALVAFRNNPKSSEAVSNAEMRLFAGLTLLLAVVGYFGFLWQTALPGQPWYFLPLMILTVACVDAVRPTWPRAAQKVFLAGALMLAVVSLPVAWRDLDYRFTNVDAWANVLANEASPEDCVVVTPWFTGVSFDRYYRGTAPWETVPPVSDHSTHRYDLIRAQMLSTNAAGPVLEKIAATLRAGHRVWFLCPVEVERIIREGVPVPRTLKSPPLPDTGWSPDPYVGVWTSQMVFLFASHGQEFHLVKSPVSEPYIGEEMDLFVISGWRDAP